MAPFRKGFLEIAKKRIFIVKLIRVPHWGVEEVLSWVAAVGFKEYCPAFKVENLLVKLLAFL